MESKELIKQEDSAIVQPAVSPEEAVKQFKAFQELKTKLLNQDDTMELNKKPYTKKTGWRKLKTAFNLSEEILESHREVREHNSKQYVQWIYKVRVKAKNGVFADAEMGCDSFERFGQNKPETVIMAMAQTRAFNRAISDLIGGGEVSAEEMEEPAQTIPIMPQKKAVKSYEGMHIEKACSGCGNVINDNVYHFSMDKIGKALCIPCQKIVQANQPKLIEESEEDGN